MTSQKISYALLRNAALVILPVALCACQVFEGPSPMPAGYTYHHDMYKSPPAARPQPVGHPYSVQTNAESAAHWRIAAGDLVAKLMASQGVLPAPVYVEPAPTVSPFNSSFDNFLREALLDNGYMLASMPGQGPVLRYNATMVEHQGERQSGMTPEAKEAAKAPDAPEYLPATGSEVVLSITLTNGMDVMAEETGIYYIPDAEQAMYKTPSLFRMPVVGDWR